MIAGSLQERIAQSKDGDKIQAGREGCQSFILLSVRSQCFLAKAIFKYLLHFLS
jgi:hypothetical protein